MSNDNTRDAAEPSPASAGSQPVAWGFAVATEDEQWDEVFYSRECAKDAAGRLNDDEEMGRWKVVPLFPQPMLGSAARERVSVVADLAAEHLGQDDPGVVALRALMERLG
jgi:hypothetical protein